MSVKISIKVSKKEVSEDGGKLTEFGSAMKELSIQTIYANSPQAEEE